MMVAMGQDEDFYEEDEHVDDLLAEFDRATERGKTTRPVSGQTRWLTIFGMASGGTYETTQRTANNVNFFAA